MTEPAETPMRLDFRVLGPVRVRYGGQEIAVGGQKPRALLGALLLARGRVVSVTALGEAIWGSEPPAALASSLQVLVSNLRKKLRSAGADATVLRTQPPGYVLDIAALDCDLGRFAAAHTTGTRAAAEGDLSSAATAFRAALAEWEGAALADLQGFRFATEAAAALDEERWACVTARIDADLAAGKAVSLVGELVSLTNAQPLREPLWVQLVTALYLAGRQADALEACRRVRTVLSSQLGIDPGAALLELEAKVLRQEDLGVELTSPAPPGRAIAAHAMNATVSESLPPVQGGWLRLWDGRQVEVASRVVRIGRMIDNDIELDDPKVSRYHAEIRPGRAGLVLTDTSTNGVLVNGERVADELLLVPGDVIQIGSAVIVFESR